MDCEMQVREIQMPPLVNPLYGFRIMGSSNGLLCVIIREFGVPLCNLPGSILVWNPATREFREITKTRRTSFCSKWDGNGFGFSATLNDFKIVQIYYEITTQIRAVEVYSLNTGLWKELELGCLEEIGFFLGDCVSANGFICWVGMKEISHNRFIVSFDMAREVFTLIPLPPISTSGIELTVYEDKVGIISLSKIGNYPNCLYFWVDLWVLEESVRSSTERWSWTKIFSSNRHRLELKFSGFPGIIWRNEIVTGSYGKYKEIITSTGCRQVKIDEENFYQYLINIITNEVKRVAIPSSFCYAFNHVESLEPISSLKNLIL
ncbi:hypothetical protein K1719_014762 [Acacia pycnantha]|nr:hypothetical protein K1719_014762 [Acacia pycnantha]